jgi:hypothetical protein
MEADPFVAGGKTSAGRHKPRYWTLSGSLRLEVVGILIKINNLD